MEIREIREDELDALVTECWLPFAEEMAALNGYNALADHVLADDDFAGSVAYREELFADDDRRTYVAVDDELVGYATAERRETPPVFARGPAVNLGELYVAESHRNDGFASALIERVERWAHEVGAEHVTLSVNADNEPAKSVYERHGYEVRRHKMDNPVR